MKPKPTAFDSQFQPGAVFGRRGLVFVQHRPIDLLDMDTTFLRGRRGVGYLEDLARCGFRIGVRSISSELHYVPILSRGQSGLTSLNDPLTIVSISIHARDMPVQRLRDGHASTLTFERHQEEQPPQRVSASRIAHWPLKPQSGSQHSIVGHQFRSVASFIGSSPSWLAEPRPDVGTSSVARLASESPFDIRQTNIIWPAAGVEGGEVAALVIGAIDQDAGHGRTHLAEGYFGLALSHYLTAFNHTSFSIRLMAASNAGLSSTSINRVIVSSASTRSPGWR
jgi:hypothetical protein